MELLKLAAVLVVIIFALRSKVSVGVVLLGAGLVTALLFGVSAQQLIDGYGAMLSSTRFISLTAVLMLVTMLGTLLREIGLLDKLSIAAGQLWGGKRTASMTLPAMIGMMPMPGGAGLSAPLVGGVLETNRLAPEKKAIVNYWFRHFMEFTWPAYPGIVLTEAIANIPIRIVAVMQLPMAIAMLAIGYFYFAREIDAKTNNTIGLFRSIRSLAAAIWPILVAMTIYGLTGVDLSLCLLAVLLLALAIYRPAPAAITSTLRSGVSFSLILFVVGVLSFQKILELSGAIAAIPIAAQSYHLPDELVIFLVCFLIGVLTSMSAAVVGLGYTVLSGFLLVPVVSPDRILLAYFSGYLGMMLAPSHLCLVLSHRYFGGSLGTIYRQMALPLLLLSLFAFVLSFSGWAKWIVGALS